MESMTPSAEKTTTAGQIDKAVANYRALLEKHSREFDSEVVQLVLGQPEFAEEQLAVFRNRVEMFNSMIVRRVRVDRSRTPEQVLEATGRKQYVTASVVAAMPKGVGKEVEVVFFNLGRFVSDDDLEKEYELRGLKPDPDAQAAVNEEDEKFADKHPNATHWKDAQGKWCFVTFNLWHVERAVNVDRDYGHVWGGGWWFGGVRK